MTWDQDGNSTWSEPAMWSIGLLEPSDWQAKWIGYDEIAAVEENSEVPTRILDIQIKSARYGVNNDQNRLVDISEKITAMVGAGDYQLEISNKLVDADPAPGVRKELVLEYTINGKSRRPSRRTY